MSGHLARGRGLALVGYRGTGKSSTGRLVAARLGMPFADADTQLVARAGRPIAAIFAQDGEPAFRDLESAVLADLCRETPALVLATGGGAVLRAENRQLLRAHGPVVWLRARVDTLTDRLCREGGESRPGLTPAGTLAEIATVLAARAPIYQEAADHAIDTDDLDPEAVADAVAAAYRLLLDPGGPRA